MNTICFLSIFLFEHALFSCFLRSSIKQATFILSISVNNNLGTARFSFWKEHIKISITFYIFFRERKVVKGM
jgi:hypothetical protein